MSLLEVQNLTARIYTDENLRLEFLAAPEKVGKQNNLTEKEIRDLAEVLPAELNFFADSLVNKRLRETEKLLPLTRKILEKNFEKYFREFANQYTPESTKKHLEDAVQFADFLQTKPIELFWARDAAKFERAKFEFHNFGKRLVFEIFDCDVRDFARQSADAPGEIRKKKTLAIWVRFGAATRHYVW